MYREVFIIFHRFTGKIVNFEISDQRVLGVNLNLSGLIQDWSDRCHLPRSTMTVSTVFWINLLKPTGHVMHQQFKIQQLYVLPTLYLCVLYLSENKQRLVPLTA